MLIKGLSELKRYFKLLLLSSFFIAQNNICSKKQINDHIATETQNIMESPRKKQSIINQEAIAQNAVNAPLPEGKSMRVCIFDLHGVLAHVNIKAVMHYMKNNLFEEGIAQSAKNISTWIKIGLHYIGSRSQLKSKSFEYHLKDYVEKNKNDMTTFNQFIYFANLQNVDQKMITELYRLKNCGCKLILASNIGIETFHYAKKAFPPLSRLFSLFDAIVCAEPDNKGKYIAKPEILFYDKIKNEIDKLLLITNQKRSDVIFIDDNERNCVVANEQEIPSILFIGYRDFKKNIDIWLKNTNCNRK